MRAVLVDDETMFAEGLRALLHFHPEVRLVRHVHTAEALLEVLPDQACDVVLMDRRLSGIDSREATRRLTLEYPNVRVIALSRRPDEVFAERMARAGAAAYLCKQHAISELVQTILDVVRSSEPQSSDSPHLAQDLGDVTQREQQVLTRVAEGDNTKEIAIELGISPKTVHVHRASGMRKLGLRGVADVVRWALRNGLIDIER